MTLAQAALTAAIAELSKSQPTHDALVHGETVLDYASLNAGVDRAAAAAVASGLSPGDRVAICAPTSIDYVVLLLGLLRAGCVPVPLSPGVTPQTLAAMVADSEAKALFAAPEQIDLLAAEGVMIPMTVLMHPTWDDWLAAGAPGPFMPVPIEEGAPFNIIYSSGTTGVPKGIVQSHAMRAAHVAAVGGLFGPGSVTLISTPLYSNTTLVALFPALYSGGTVVLQARFDADDWLRLAERHGVTHTMLVPVQYRRLLDSPVFDTVDLSRFELKFCTSAPFSADLKAETLRRWPGGLLEIFGMTEGGAACFLAAHLFPDKLHTVGTPMAGSDIRIIGETGAELPRGEIGEIVGRSGQMMDGYNNRPDQTVSAEWRSSDGQRFIRTGDLGCFDQDGFLEIRGRAKDLIISGGFNIYPGDLEAILDAHPDVKESAVIGIDDPRWGETPVGFIVASADPILDPAMIRDWANARLGRTQKIAWLHVLPELPRNALGKVVKGELPKRGRPEA